MTKVAVGSFSFKKNRRYMPKYEAEDTAMTSQQRKTIIDLIYSRISNQDEIESRLSQLEDYNFLDAQEVIQDFLFAPWK